MTETDLISDEQRRRLARLARARNWRTTFILVAWLHLAAFGLCHCLSSLLDYHGFIGYLLVWIGELGGMIGIFWLCGGGPRQDVPEPLERCVQRVWLAYFILAFNLASLNSLRGHQLFEFLPAMASLASFAFIMMAVIVERRFIIAAPIMFVSGLLMAADLPHAYLIFGVAWWVVLHGIGVALWRERSAADAATTHPAGDDPILASIHAGPTGRTQTKLSVPA